MHAVKELAPMPIVGEALDRTAAMSGVARNRLRRPRLLQLLCALPLLAGASATAVAAEPETADRAALEKQLDSARARLDEAAREVARLTRQLHGDDDATQFVQRGGGQRGAMLGVNIGGEQTRDEGVEIMGVSPSGPAQAAGLRKGDIVMAIDGKPLRRAGDSAPSRQLVEHLRTVKPGQAVKLDYVRDGKRASATVTTTAAEPPLARLLREHLPGGIPPEFEDFLGGRSRAFGALELVPVTPKLGQYFGTDKGLLVVRAPATPGLEEGDVILSIDGRIPENPRHAFRILGSYQPAEKVKFELLRQRKRMTVDIQVPEAPANDGSFRPRGPATPPAPPPPPAPPAGGRPAPTSA
jgi:membrane-associated protease RseP (regulator of RpoE activity)